jgi:ABC-type transport system involved in cytochrome c biogenesis permease component
MHSVSLPPLRRWISHLFEINPVFKRELRARWRRPAAYLTLFFYAAPLALGMALIYADKAPGNLQETYQSSDEYVVVNPPLSSVPVSSLPGYATADDVFSVGDQLAEFGRDLFIGLAMLQVVTWLLIAPAIASSAIAAERERGLLEALHLANLPAHRVVLGKWLSTLSFMGLLFLVPLPVMAICFFFGGVTPEEFRRAAITVFATALCGSALGLWFSSRRARPVQALRDVFVLVVLWSGLAYLSHDRSAAYDSLPFRVRQVVAAAELAHPVSAIARFKHDEFLWPLREVTENEDVAFGNPYLPIAPPVVNVPPPAPPVVVAPMPAPSSSSGPPPTIVAAPIALPPPLYEPINEEDHWLINLALLALLTLLFFGLAVRGTGRTLTDAAFLRRDWVGRLKMYLESRKQSRLSGAQKALFAEIAFFSTRSFDNPVFGREMRGKSRLKGGPWWLWILRIVFVLVPTLFYIQVLAEVNVSLRREDAFERLSYAGLALLCLYASLAGAGAFTRERESGTWEGLKLTLLQPSQILSGKVWPLVISLSALSLLLMPGFLLCLGQSAIDDDSAYNRGYVTQVNISLLHITFAFTVILSTAFAVGAAAIFVSWLCRRTPLAVGLSILVGAFMCFMMPAPFQSALTTPFFTLQQLPQPEPRPFVVPKSVDGYYYGDLTQRQADENYHEAIDHLRVVQKSFLWCPVTMLSFGCILLLILSVLMRQQFRDEK